MRTAAGVQTEAVYIFHNMVRRLRSVHKPDYLAAIFESFAPTFRDEVFAEYKNLLRFVQQVLLASGGAGVVPIWHFGR